MNPLYLTHQAIQHEPSISPTPSYTASTLNISHTKLHSVNPQYLPHQAIQHEPSISPTPSYTVWTLDISHTKLYSVNPQYLIQHEPLESVSTRTTLLPQL
jgi:hypothetical protein